MLKKYVSRLSRVGIYVEVDGQVVPVDLTPGFIDDKGNRGSVFVTDDVKLQKAIELHSSFGPNWMSDIYLADAPVVTEAPTVTAPVVESTEVTKKTRKRNVNKQ